MEALISSLMELATAVGGKGEDYWDVYFDLTQSITEAMAAQGVQAPAVRVNVSQ